MAKERGEVLFELPIDGSGGNVTVTQPAKQIYLITFTSGADNRLISVRLISSYRKALAAD